MQISSIPSLMAEGGLRSADPGGVDANKRLRRGPISVRSCARGPLLDALFMQILVLSGIGALLAVQAFRLLIAGLIAVLRGMLDMVFSTRSLRLSALALSAASPSSFTFFSSSSTRPSAFPINVCSDVIQLADILLGLKGVREVIIT